MKFKTVKELVEEFGDVVINVMKPKSSDSIAVPRYGMSVIGHTSILWMDNYIFGEIGDAPHWAKKEEKKVPAKKLYAFSILEKREVKKETHGCEAFHTAERVVFYRDLDRDDLVDMKREKDLDINYDESKK